VVAHIAQYNTTLINNKAAEILCMASYVESENLELSRVPYLHT